MDFCFVAVDLATGQPIIIGGSITNGGLALADAFGGGIAGVALAQSLDALATPLQEAIRSLFASEGRIEVRARPQ